MVKLIKPTPSTNFVRGWITTGSGHRGLDYGYVLGKVQESTKILAAAAGKVISVYEGAGFNYGWGRRIKIDHGHGNVTTYNHIRPGGVLVEVGDTVKAGDLIGLMGSSGASTGTHLHFELYINGVRVDPAPFFSKHLPGTEPEDTTKPKPATSSSGSSLGTFKVPSNGQYYYWHLENALEGDYARNQTLRGGQTLTVVENSGKGPVRVRCADGDLVWVGTRNNPAKVTGATKKSSSTTTKKSEKQEYVFDVPSNGQYYYRTLGAALSGSWSRSQLIPGNTKNLKVIQNSGQGPVKVDYKGGVWVGTRNNPAKIQEA